MALDEFSLVASDTLYRVVRYAVPWPSRPAFMIPLVGTSEQSNQLFIQHVGTNGRVNSFVPFDSHRGAQRELEGPHAIVSIGDLPIYVVLSPSGEPLVGAQREIADEVRSWISKLKPFPLTRLAFADFCDDHVLVKDAAKRLFKVKQSSANSEYATSWFLNSVIFRRVQRALVRAVARLSGTAVTDLALDLVQLDLSQHALYITLPAHLYDVMMVSRDARRDAASDIKPVLNALGRQSIKWEKRYADNPNPAYHGATSAPHPRSPSRGSRSQPTGREQAGDLEFLFGPHQPPWDWPLLADYHFFFVHGITTALSLIGTKPASHSLLKMRQAVAQERKAAGWESAVNSKSWDSFANANQVYNFLSGHNVTFTTAASGLLAVELILRAQGFRGNIYTDEVCYVVPQISFITRLTWSTFSELRETIAERFGQPWETFFSEQIGQHPNVLKEMIEGRTVTRALAEKVLALIRRIKPSFSGTVSEDLTERYEQLKVLRGLHYGGRMAQRSVRYSKKIGGSPSERYFG
jgi:hypothetical protein